MSDYHFGTLLGILTALCWTGSAIAFSEASRRVGSVPVNLIRLVVAFLLLSAACWVTRGKPFPTDATPHQALWLALSGVVGFFIGDLTLFRAFVLIGPRRSTLLMALAPAFAALTDFFARGVQLLPLQTLGVFLTIAGVMWVTVERVKSTQEQATRISRWGIALGLIGALGQGVGSVMTSHAFAYGRYDMFASTQIRAAAAIPLFVVFILVAGRMRDTLVATKNGRAMGYLTLGAIFGPFLGVSLFNGSVARIPAGVTSTLAGMVPIFMIPVAAYLERERISWRAVIGALVAVAGVAMLTLLHG